MSERVERLRELEAKASPAKWKYKDRGDAAFIVSGVGPDRMTVCEIGGCFVIDAELICALRNSAPALLKCADLLRSIRDNFDCDEDAHRYNTECRKCAAAKALLELEREE